MDASLAAAALGAGATHLRGTGIGPVLLDEPIEMINASLDGYVEGPDQGLESRVARQRRTTLLVT